MDTENNTPQANEETTLSPEQMETVTNLVEAEEVGAQEVETEEGTGGEFELELKYADPEKQEDVDWRERTGLNDDSLCAAIETLIFMSDRPIQIQKIKNYIDAEMPLRVIHSSITCTSATRQNHWIIVTTQ